MRITLLFTLLTLMVMGNVYGQTLFEKKYFPKNQQCVAPLIGSVMGEEHLVLTSSVSDSTTESSPLVFKVNAITGEVIWAKKYTNSRYSFNILSITTSPQQAILISGLYLPTASVGITKPFALLIDKDGNLLWCKDFSDITLLPSVKAIFLSDNSILVGYSTRMAPYDVVLNKFNFTGEPIWQKTFGSYAFEASSEQFKDVIATSDGGFYLLTENDYKTAQTKAGICLFDPSGTVSKCINLQSIDNNNINPSSLIESHDAQLLLAVKQHKSIVTLKINNLSTIEWTSNPFSRGWSFDDEFILSSSPTNPSIFLIGQDDYGDEGYTGLRLVKYDSFMLSKSISLSKPEHQLDNGNGGVLVNGDAVYIASTIKARQPNYPVMTLTKLNTDLGGCSSPNNHIFQASFIPTTIAPYPAQVMNKNFVSFTIELKQEAAIVDTALICEKDYFDCKKQLELGADYTVCNDSVFYLKPPYFASYKYLWSTKDTTKNIVVHKSGTYSLTLIPPAGFSCDTLIDSVYLRFVHIPNLQLNLLENPVWPNYPFQVKVSNPVYDSIKWNYKNNIVQYGDLLMDSFPTNGYYAIQVTGYQHGCFIADTITLEVKGQAIYIPDAFTPNGDHINDVFKPIGAGIADYELDVYNSWGQLIFSGKNMGWNGTSHNTFSPSGTYAYVLKYVTDKQFTFHKNGTITLIR